jgi:uncharacterized protein
MMRFTRSEVIVSEHVDAVALSRSECLSLMDRGAIGRVVFTESALPAVQPVNYVLDGEEVLFRTRNGSKLAAASRHTVVGFQVDEFDVTTKVGWSVLGIGEAYEIVAPQRLAEIADIMPPPWVSDHVDHTICIPLQRLTGRRIALTARTEP